MTTTITVRFFVRFGHDDAGPFYRVVTEESEPTLVREFGRLDDAVYFAQAHNDAVDHVCSPDCNPGNCEVAHHEHFWM